MGKPLDELLFDKITVYGGYVSPFSDADRNEKVYGLAVYGNGFLKYVVVLLDLYVIACIYLHTAKPPFAII